jgi:glutamate racemase
MRVNDGEIIGVFDSGLGGLTVLKEIMKQNPNADIVYFGDTRNAPYGDRTQAELGALTAQAFYFLKKNGATKIVTACNSVSTLFMGDFLHTLGIDGANVVEMSIPAAQSIAKLGYRKVLVIATIATVRSHMHRDALRKYGVHADELAISGLVELIEAGAEQSEIIEHIQAHIGIIDVSKYDAILLGCTHFPLITEALKEVFGTSVVLVDPAQAVARELLQVSNNDKAGSLRLYTSSESEVFNHKVAEMFGGEYKVLVV